MTHVDHEKELIEAKLKSIEEGNYPLHENPEEAYRLLLIAERRLKDRNKVFASTAPLALAIALLMFLFDFPWRFFPKIEYSSRLSTEEMGILSLLFIITMCLVIFDALRELRNFKKRLILKDKYREFLSAKRSEKV